MAAEPVPATKVTDTVTPESPVAANVVAKQITGSKSDADPKGSSFSLLRAKGAAESKGAIKLSWQKVAGATFAVYAGAYASRAAAMASGDPVATMTSVAGGPASTAADVLDLPGDYTVVETGAPADYKLNETWYDSFNAPAAYSIFNTTTRVMSRRRPGTSRFFR